MILQSHEITKNDPAHGETRGGEISKKQDFMKYEDQIPFLDFSFFPVDDGLFDFEKVVEDILDGAGRDENDVQLQDQTSSQLEQDNLPFSHEKNTSFLRNLYHPCDPSPSLRFPKNKTSSELSLPSLLTDNKSLEENQVNRFKPHHEQKWIRRFKEFLEFVGENGHGAVPNTYPENQQLARWVNRQRRQCKLFQDGQPSTITEDRFEMLASAGFIWDAHEVTWREKLEALREFYQKNRHCVVPIKYKEQGLGIWVKSQRRQYKLYLEGKPSSMNSQRIAELERLNFDWEVRKDQSKDSNSDTIDLVFPTLNRANILTL